MLVAIVKMLVVLLIIGVIVLMAIAASYGGDDY
jgi:hypothetical protein